MSIVDKLLNRVGLSWNGNYEEYYFQKERASRDTKPSASEFFAINPHKPSRFFNEPLKDQAKTLLDDARYYANEINKSMDPFDFIFSFERFLEIINQLIWLNETKHVFMYPSPRRNFEDIERNFDKTINDFISRAIGNIKSTGTQRLVDINVFLDSVLEDPDFFLFPQNVDRINTIKKENELHLEPSTEEELTETCPIKKLNIKTQPKVDCEAIIKAEENWRREQRGLSPIENELLEIDKMEGHAFEEWCAALLRKNGFENVLVTPGSNDQGVDIVAEKEEIYYAIQCKCYSSDLGNTPVQEVYAGKEMYNCQVAVVLTNRHFTEGAKALAKRTRVLLWDREKIIELLKSQN